MEIPHSVGHGFIKSQSIGNADFDRPNAVIWAVEIKVVFSRHKLMILFLQML